MKHLSMKQYVVILAAITNIAIVGGWAFDLIPKMSSDLRTILSLGAVLCAVAIGLILFRIWSRYQQSLAQVETSRAAAQNSHENAHRYLLGRLSELRRPLQGILGVRDVYNVESKNPEFNDFIDVVNHCVKFVVRQLDRIQFFSEFETGKVVASWKPFELHETIEKVVFDAEQSTFGKPAKIDIEIDSRVPKRVIGDRKLIGKALYEILSNAVKHINCGPVRIHVTCENRTNQINFTVSDFGPGLGQKELAMALNLADQTIKRTSWSETHGLGFATVRQISRALNGRYTVETKTGQGTQVSLQLPLEPSDVAVISDKPHEHAPSSHILVVDDEALTRQLMKKLLEKLGYSVTLAENGDQALAVYAQKKFGVIFMDIEMPEMNGLSAAGEILRIAPAGARPKIIALTGHGLTEDRERCSKAGMVDMLIKPAGVKDIEAMLRRLGVKPLNTLKGADMGTSKFQKEIELTRMFALYGEDERLVKEAFRQAVGNLPKIQDDLSAHIMKSEVDKIRQFLKRLKEEFAALHCDKGVDLCDRAHSFAGNMNTIEFLSAVDELNKTIHRTIKEMKSIMAAKDFAAFLD